MIGQYLKIKIWILNFGRASQYRQIFWFCQGAIILSSQQQIFLAICHDYLHRPINSKTFVLYAPLNIFIFCLDLCKTISYLVFFIQYTKQIWCWSPKEIQFENCRIKVFLFFQKNIKWVYVNYVAVGSVSTPLWCKGSSPAPSSSLW